MIASGFWWGLGIGLVSGACLGIVLAALLAAAANADRTAEEIYRRLPPQDPDVGVEHRNGGKE